MTLDHVYVFSQKIQIKIKKTKFPDFNASSKNQIKKIIVKNNLFEQEGQ